VHLGVRGAHQVMNALAAAAAALAAGVSPEDTVEGLAHAALSPWRMDLQRTPSGALVLNDAYNANPTSVEAALRSLAALPISAAGRRVAVLGVMAELGPNAPELHRATADLAGELGITVIAVDAPDYGQPVVQGVDGALAALEAMGPLHEGDAVLVKGSRVAGLERLAEKLVARVT
jgi:UDP-N-acetylmuramoyl-tripeptide--D-alanyl-D-alanine ligase